jgi:acetyl esterase/lipase
MTTATATNSEVPTLGFTIPATVNAQFDIQFGVGGDTPLLLDLYQPKASAKGLRAAIVWIHGGGWHSGDKQDPKVARVAVALADRGYVVANINYRLSGTAIFPAAVHDVKCAVRWMRANAEKYGFDENRIGTMGRSAGAHLGLMLGLTPHVKELEGTGGHPEFSSAVKVICAWFPPTFFKNTPLDKNGKGRAPLAFLGGTFEEKPDNYRAAAPLTYAHKDTPPILLVHGDADTTVPFAHSTVLYEKLNSLSADVTFINVKNGEHGFEHAEHKNRVIEPTWEEIRETSFKFLDKHLC